ncbi:MAG: hypothetical protein PHV11_01380 [Candidatus Bipolaricaulis sp.]|nr:hypothetical protein [Candidatus Bipolaricaulis sp.]
MKWVRTAGWVLAAAALAFGFSVLGGSSGNSWRERVSPSLLRWADSNPAGERVVLVLLKEDAIPDAPETAYVEAAHAAWLSDAVRAIAAAVEDAAALEPAGLILRAGSEVCEVGFPYVHELRTLVARCTAAGVARVAQLAFVESVSDGTDPVPALAGPADPAPSSEEGAGTPQTLLARGRLPTDELRWDAATHGWTVVRLSDVVRVDGGASLSVSPTPLSEWDVEAYRVVALGIDGTTRAAAEGRGAQAASLFQGTWAIHPTTSLSRASLAWIVDSARQVGADTVAVATVATTVGDLQTLVFLRGETTLGLASATGHSAEGKPGEAVLPRAAAPMEVTTTRGSHQDRVSILWTGVAGASRYEVLRSEAAQGAFAPIAIAGIGGFDDTNVETCQKYWYRVRAIGGGGVGLESNAADGYVGLVPKPVQRIGTSPDPAGAITVTWSPVPGATSYRLMRTQPMTDKPNVAAQQYAVYAGTEPTFVDTDIVVGQTYFYRVFADNGCGRAELSPQTEGKATRERPLDRSRLNPPTWIEATRGRPYDKVRLSWRAASGAAAYRILRAIAYTGPYEKLTETASTTYEDPDVILCGDYWYRIQSLAGRTESEPSVTVYGSYGYRPEAPQNVRASVGTYANSIEIAWSPMADAQLYHVSRAPKREGPYAVIANGLTATTYVDEGLVPGQEFWYKVKAANACGCSGDLGPAHGATTPK